MPLRYRYNMDPKKSSPIGYQNQGPHMRQSRLTYGSRHRSVSPGHSYRDSKGPRSRSLPRLPNTSSTDSTGFQKFTLAEMKRLGQRFRKLDSDRSGSVTLKEFLQVPEIRKNILANRVVEAFDTNKNGEVDFHEFVTGMSQFCSDNVEGRLRFAFRIYDLDGNGFITNGELFQVMKMMVGENLTDIQIQETVDHTFMIGDNDNDGQISFEEFVRLVRHKGTTPPDVVLRLI